MTFTLRLSLAVAITAIIIPKLVKAGSYGWQRSTPNSPFSKEKPFTFYLDNGIVRRNPDKNFYDINSLEPRNDYFNDYGDEWNDNDDDGWSMLDQTIQASQNVVAAAYNTIGWKWLPLVFLAISLLPEYHHIVKRDLSPDHSSILQNTKEILLKLDQTYNAAVGSELCLKRIVCELGARNQNLENGYKNVITRLMTDLTPENYKQFTEDFTAGLLRGKCEKFKCVTNLSKLFSTLNNIIL